MADARRILLVDDDVDFRESLRDALTEEGYALAAARDGSEALGYLRSNEAPSLILLDWNMAPMNGAQFMEEFVKVGAWAGIPVVLLTADARASDKALRYTFAEFLRKPFLLGELLTLIERYMGV